MAAEIKRNRKEEIFEAAVLCFNERGYYGASIDAIAERARISKGGIYYHFTSKKQLFLDLFHYRVQKYFDRIKEIIKEITNADILLLSLSNLPGAEKIIPAKLFEYMATGNHILAMLPNGEAKDILAASYKNVTFCDPDDIIQLTSVIISKLKNITKSEKRQKKEYTQYTRKYLAGELVNFLNYLEKSNR